MIAELFDREIDKLSVPLPERATDVPSAKNAYN